CAGESHRSKAGAHLRAGQPAAEPQGAPGSAGDGAHKIEPAKQRWKRRSVEKSENRLFPSAWEYRKRRGIPTFPPPQQQQPEGYISNGATTHPTDTLLNVLTRVTWYRGAVREG